MGEWRTVVGWPSYEVSSLGQVRSFKWGRPHLLKQQSIGSTRNSPLKGRYLRVALWIDGVRSERMVHHLVLEAFVGPRPLGLEACHKDDDPTNNALDNLRWDTKQSNRSARGDYRGRIC